MMAKLTKKDRMQALIELQTKVAAAIDGAPSGLTVGEICHCLIAAAIAVGVVK